VDPSCRSSNRQLSVHQRFLPEEKKKKGEGKKKKEDRLEFPGRSLSYRTGTGRRGEKKREGGDLVNCQSTDFLMPVMHRREEKKKKEGSRPSILVVLRPQEEKRGGEKEGRTAGAYIHR